MENLGNIKGLEEANPEKTTFLRLFNVTINTDIDDFIIEHGLN